MKTKQPDINCVIHDFTVIKETEKALRIDAPFLKELRSGNKIKSYSFWCPRSQVEITDGMLMIPRWLIQKIQTEGVTTGWAGGSGLTYQRGLMNAPKPIKERKQVIRKQYEVTVHKCHRWSSRWFHDVQLPEMESIGFTEDILKLPALDINGDRIIWERRELTVEGALFADKVPTETLETFKVNSTIHTVRELVWKKMKSRKFQTPRQGNIWNKDTQRFDPATIGVMNGELCAYTIKPISKEES